MHVTARTCIKQAQVIYTIDIEAYMCKENMHVCKYICAHMHVCMHIGLCGYICIHASMLGDLHVKMTILHAGSMKGCV